MKIFLYLVFIMLFFASANADDDKYINTMKKNIISIDTAQTFTGFNAVANNFERIAQAEKDKWLPYYYSAFVYTLSTFADSVRERKDLQLDKADEFVKMADSLEPDNSEIYTLKGMIAQARLQIDPMNRWQKYGALSTQNFEKAMKLNPANPRPEYLMGVGLFYTPEQFGGGPKAAKPYLENSLKKYNEFKPENDLMPNWGKGMVINLLSQMPAQ